MNATNDHNEGKLGKGHVDFRRAPKLGLGQWNAKTIYKSNDTGQFMQEVLTPDDHSYI